MQVTTIGLDIAKNVFQVHGIDGNEKVVIRKQLRRGQVKRFLRSCRRAWSDWRPVPRRIIWRLPGRLMGGLLGSTGIGAPGGSEGMARRCLAVADVAAKAGAWALSDLPASAGVAHARH